MLPVGVTKFVEGVSVEGDGRKCSAKLNFLVNRERLSIIIYGGCLTGLESPNTNDFPGPSEQMFEISPFLIEFSFQFCELHEQRYFHNQLKVF